MLARRPRGSDTAGRTSPRTSPALDRSRGSFFARIFVFFAFFVGAASGQQATQGYCTDPSAGCCECLCDGEPLTNPPVYLAKDDTSIDIDSEYRCSGSSGMGSGAANSCQDFYDFNGEQCVTGTESTRWVYPPPCTTSQYLDGDSCKACPISSGNADANSQVTPPPSISTGGDATYCTCPDDYYGYVDAISGQWVCGFCGASSEKFGSIVPTATGVHDTCTCKAGHYLVSVPPMCTACPSDQTSAGGSLGECTPYHSASCSATAPRATGGTVTAVGDYTIHTFTSGGTFAVVDTMLTWVDVLVVGGGGAGHMSDGGGGGGGEVLYDDYRAVSTTSYSVVVGDGGRSDSNPQDGGQSSFGTMVAGGGKGGNLKEGGRSGGDGPYSITYAGGLVDSVTPDAPGGGGGAGGRGEDGDEWSSSSAGNGGQGALSSISGTSTYYGGGGGGAAQYSFSAGSGGLGGGGAGDPNTGQSVPGTGSPNTGGGGGGSKTGFGESRGGSGIVIIRYKNPSSCVNVGARADGGTVTTAGDYVIHTFNSDRVFANADSTLTEVDVLVVGGGGGGASSNGRGGGGGEVVYTSGKSISATSYAVMVGSGGMFGGNGGYSEFDDIRAAAGMGGSDPECAGCSGNGNAFGAQWGAVSDVSNGGGGGAGGPGPDAVGPSDVGANGGIGVQSDISGTLRYYGGGGGGAGIGKGGSGGGGDAWDPFTKTIAKSGSQNTGGGGGGLNMNHQNAVGSGGWGGSGVVIVRYKKTAGSTPPCTTSQYVNDGSCVACPSSTSSDPMDPTTPSPSTSAGGEATYCTCPNGFYAATGATAGEWSCYQCGDDFEISSSRVPTVSGNSDVCDCKAGYYLDSTGLICYECPAGQTSAGGRVTECTSSSTPVASSPPPPAAQALNEAAEETRDAILADIADPDIKKKAKLLADAAIAGETVQKLSAKLTAADPDAACSSAYSKAGVSPGMGVCVAAPDAAGRRRLSQTAYDVELMFKSSEVSDADLAAAVNELKANGVEGVTSQASVNPITELKTFSSVDTTKLQTFETQAAAAAAAAPSASAQTPPTPPPPPKPNLVLDDDDAAVGLGGGLVACVAAMLVLVM